MDSWPNTVLQVSLRELFCVTHLDVTFWLKWAEKMLSFCQRLIGYPLEQTAPKELFVQTNYFMCSYRAPNYRRQIPGLNAERLLQNLAENYI